MNIKFKKVLELLNVVNDEHVEFLINSAEKLFTLPSSSHYGILYLMAGYDPNTMYCDGMKELELGDNPISYGQYVGTADWKETFEDFQWHASSLIGHTTVDGDFIDEFFEMEEDDSYDFILEEFDIMLNGAFEHSIIMLDTHSDQYVYTIVKNENKEEVMQLLSEIFDEDVMVPREL